MAGNNDVFNSINENIGAILSQKQNKEWNNDEFARRITIEIMKKLPKQWRKMFEVDGDDKITTEEIDNYCRKNLLEANVFTRGDNSVIEFPYYISETQLTNYKSGQTPIPTTVLVACCNLLNMSLEEIVSQAYKTAKLPWKSNVSLRTSPVYRLPSDQFVNAVLNLKEDLNSLEAELANCLQTREITPKFNY